MYLQLGANDHLWLNALRSKQYHQQMSMIELFKVISVVAIASDAIATYPKIIFFFGRQPRST